MKDLEDAIVEHIKQKSLNYKIKQFEHNRLQAINSINRRINNQTS